MNETHIAKPKYKGRLSNREEGKSEKGWMEVSENLKKGRNEKLKEALSDLGMDF